jgi:hypothetical protein
MPALTPGVPSTVNGDIAMSMSVNTNVNSLTAQRNLSMS